MQNPNEDSEWNDVLRAKGIIPPKECEIEESKIIEMLEDTIKHKVDGQKDINEMDLDELDELEDSEDELVLKEYRNKRIAEMKELAFRSRFGSVKEISGVDYVDEVNKAGDNIWVILHLYARGNPVCGLINKHFDELANKFPTAKFLRSIATTCIPNFPEKNLPAIFIYFEGQIKKQIIDLGKLYGPNLTRDELEFLLGTVGAVNTEIKEDPRKKTKDKLFEALADTNDW